MPAVILQSPAANSPVFSAYFSGTFLLSIRLWIVDGKSLISITGGNEMSFWKPISFMALAAILILSLAGCSPALLGASVAPVLTTGSVQQGDPTQQVTTPVGGGITVAGTGQVAGSPDIAHIVIGIETQGKDVKKAIADNNTQMTALLTALKTAGIAAKDIQTMNYSVSVENPQVSAGQTGSTETPVAVIYHISNQVNVTVRDITKLSDVLDDAVSSGANSIYGVSFDVSDPSKLEDQARAKAVADAKSRAEKLAQLEGLTLGNVITVSETSANPIPLYANAYAMGKGGGGAPIESGSIMVTVTLQVTYAIK
jgi:uncharacterized protein